MTVRRLQWTSPAAPDQVAPMRRKVGAAAIELGLDSYRSDRLQIAISEALTNVVVHAYENGPGEVDIDLERDDAEVRVTISDGGRGLRGGASYGLGLGLGIIATAADRCEIRTDPTFGTRLTIAFDLDDDAPSLL